MQLPWSMRYLRLLLLFRLCVVARGETAGESAADKEKKSLRGVIDAPRVTPVDVSAHIHAAKAVLAPLAPLVLKIDLCNGLTNQRIALIDGIVMGLMLGMQILLPDRIPLDGTEKIDGIDHQMRPPSELFDVKNLSIAVNDLYTEFWCEKHMHEAPSSLWCGEGAHNAFVTTASAEEVESAFVEVHGVDPNVKILSIDSRGSMDSSTLLAYRHMLFNGITRVLDAQERAFLDAKCTLFRLQVDEADQELWKLYWRVDDAVAFTTSIQKSAQNIMDAIEAYRVLSLQRATARGFPTFRETPSETRAFNVLHLRAEEDWLRHCEQWMPLQDGIHRDNCMNNTQNIAELLITEGLDPRLPLYISTGLNTDELNKMVIPSQHGKGFSGLSDFFTVVTKEVILQWGLQSTSYASSREQWGAVDSLIALAARTFVGNSVSSFSAYIMMARQRAGNAAWHYNGGSVPLQDAGFLRPRADMAVPTFREPLKWVFVIHVGSSDLSTSFVNMVKVAVLSARYHTSLIPVCITTAEPRSPLSMWLVAHGVRVVHHTPDWAPRMREKVKDIIKRYEDSGTARDQLPSHLYGDPDAMIGTFMRIDIPIVGFLDEFVLYTDVDVMFKGDVDWGVLLDGVRSGPIYRHNDFARGKFKFTTLGQQGLPLYLSASSESTKQTKPEELNAGVLLLNMRSLRETYEGFRDFIFASEKLDYPEGPGDQGAYKAFYKDKETLRPYVNFLPWKLNWKTYWEPSREAKIIHFHGPKCKEDVIPYLESGQVRMEVFQGLLEMCTKSGDCANLCTEFENYVKHAS